MLAILTGFAIGIAIDNPMAGAIYGTIAGVVIALALWFVDRRR